jgi:hypothetical protein
VLRALDQELKLAMSHHYRLQRLTLAVIVAAIMGSSGSGRAQVPGAANEFNDSHFHLTNYIQQGIDVRQFLQIMGKRVERATLFGIPLQQHWS